MNKPRLLCLHKKKGQNLNIFYYSEKYIKKDLKIRGGGRKKDLLQRTLFTSSSSILCFDSGEDGIPFSSKNN